MDIKIIYAISILSYLFGWALCRWSHKRHESKEEWVSLNLFAERVAGREGKKKAVNIAQIKEIMKIVFHELSRMRSGQIKYILRRYQ